MDAEAKYTDGQRDEALRLYEELGPASASQRCGIPSNTIRSWAHRARRTAPKNERTRAATEAAQLSWAQRRFDPAKATGEAVADLLERIRAARKPHDVRALVQAVAALVEKGQLLDGSPTDRVEVAEGEGVERVKEMTGQLHDQLAERRAAKGS